MRSSLKVDVERIQSRTRPNGYQSWVNPDAIFWPRPSWSKRGRAIISLRVSFAWFRWVWTQINRSLHPNQIWRTVIHMDILLQQSHGCVEHSSSGRESSSQLLKLLSFWCGKRIWRHFSECRYYTRCGSPLTREYSRTACGLRQDHAL